MRRSAMRDALWAHGVFLAVLGASALIAIWLDLSGRVPQMARPIYIDAHHYLFVALLPVYFLGLAVVLYRLKHRVPWPEAWREARRTVATDQRLLHMAVAVIGVRLCLMVAVTWKVAIPQVHPFRYDVAFSQADHWLHFGRQPWQWFAFLLDMPLAMRLLDAFYAFWFAVFGAVCVWMAWQRPSAYRARFFIAMALTWVVLGNVVATLFASAGPVYFADVTGLASPYAVQMAKLRALDLMAIHAQDALWRAHLNGPTSLVAGIAALPSLHVAIPALFAIALWRTHRRWSWFFWADTALTELCSFLLGWHYAVDGYVGILGVAVIWWVASKLAPADQPQTTAKLRAVDVGAAAPSTAS